VEFATHIVEGVASLVQQAAEASRWRHWCGRNSGGSEKLHQLEPSYTIGPKDPTKIARVVTPHDGLGPNERYGQTPAVCLG
jgi:hypothetical protein